MGDVALEIPLSSFAVRGFVECDDAGGARVEVFGEAFDRSALASGVTTFEDDDVFGARVLTPVLEFQQFDLQSVLLEFVLFAVHLLVVRVPFPPSFDGPAHGVDEVRIRGLTVLDGVSFEAEFVDVLPQILLEQIVHEILPFRCRHRGVPRAR